MGIMALYRLLILGEYCTCSSHAWTLYLYSRLHCYRSSHCAHVVQTGCAAIDYGSMQCARVAKDKFIHIESSDVG